jgi:hypothetical protein
MSADRVWYMHRNGMKEGPFTLAEMLERKRDGVLKADSQVWRNGMAGWVAAASVEELKGSTSNEGRFRVGRGAEVKEQASTRDFEKSLVMELRRGVEEVEDKTTAIDRSLLKKAKTEAAQAVRLERKTGGSEVASVRGAMLGSRSRGLGWKTYVAVAPLLAVALGVVALRMHWISPAVLGPQAKAVLEPWFSAVPEIPGLSPEEMRALRAAVEVESSRVGIATAFLREGEQFALIVASNLPDGTVLRVAIRGLESNVEVSFPMTLQRGLARSRALTDLKGRALAPGRYEVFVVDGESSEQSPAAVARLKALAPDASTGNAARLPAGLPVERKFTWFEERLAR